MGYATVRQAGQLQLKGMVACVVTPRIPVVRVWYQLGINPAVHAKLIPDAALQLFGWDIRGVQTTGSCRGQPALLV